MKIVVAHNYYQQAGGEDAVFAAETALLEERGHRVLRYTMNNNVVGDMNPLALVGKTLWNGETYRIFRRLVRRERPEVVHFHNTFPLISPAAYYGAKAEGAAVVQTLHNFRLVCPSALLFRAGRICEDCLKRGFPWPAIVHGCYRGSRGASGVVVGMLTLHRVLRTWMRIVDAYVVLTEFARRKFIEAGLPADKISVKPNFVYPDPGVGEGKGGYALFVGRLVPEKGVRTLLRAWKRLGRKVPLIIVGDGPLAEEVRHAAVKVPGVHWLGWKRPKDVLALMGEAAFLVFPSEWYETFGRVAIEAFAKGTPVVAAAIGAVGEVTQHMRTGLHFRPGDVEDLVAKVEWLLSHPQELVRMRREARAEYEDKYTAERNYEMLMEIYQRAMEANRKA